MTKRINYSGQIQFISVIWREWKYMIYFICTSFSLPSTLECPKSILAPHDHRSREKQILQFNKVHKGIRISNQSYNVLLITLLGGSYLALYKACLCFPKFGYEQMFWKHTGIISVMIFGTKISPLKRVLLAT